MNRVSVSFRVTLVALALGILGSAPEALAAPPVLTVPSSQTVQEGQLLQFNVSAVDPEGQTIYLYTTILPPGASFDDHHNGTGTLSWTPDLGMAGSYSATFVADDGFGGTDQESVAIEVMEGNSAPVLIPIGDRTVERGTQLVVSLSGWDPDGDPLSYSATGLPGYGTLYDFGDGNGALSFQPTSSTPLGATSMTVELSDGALSASETFAVTVVSSATAEPPVLAAIGSRTVTEGSPVSVSLSASDADGDLLTWSFSLPGFANGVVLTSAPGSSTARLDLSPGTCDAGSYPASVSVNDGTLNDSEAFTVVVTDRNRAPVWTVPAGGYALTIAAGGSGTLSVSASDPDQACGGPAPVLSVTGWTGGDALQASMLGGGQGSGTLQVVASSQASGAYTVTIRATDGAYPAAAESPVAVTVIPSTTGPVARAWTDSDPLRLDIGKPRDRFYLEPVEATFDIHSVVLESIRLRVESGSGISPLPDRFVLDQDRDQNGVAEMKMEFGKTELRELLAFTGPGSVPLTLTATLEDGRTVTATVDPNVVPERPRAIKRLGPNPLNPEAVVTVHQERDGRLRVRVYDVSGRLVRTLVDDASRAAGDYDLRFDGRRDDGTSLSSGRYYLRVEAADTVDSGAVTIMK